MNTTIKTINSHCTIVFNSVSDGCKNDTVIFSYNTPVLRIDAFNNIHRLWNGYSKTTLSDINKSVPSLHINKKQWDAMTVEY